MKVYWFFGGDANRWQHSPHSRWKQIPFQLIELKIDFRKCIACPMTKFAYTEDSRQWCRNLIETIEHHSHWIIWILICCWMNKNYILKELNKMVCLRKGYSTIWISISKRAKQILIVLQLKTPMMMGLSGVKNASVNLKEETISIYKM